MGFPSASEIGAALSRNMIGSSPDHEVVVSEVRDLVASLTHLLDKAAELSDDQRESDSSVSHALATFAEETQAKIDHLAATALKCSEWPSSGFEALDLGSSSFM